jgi:linoleate 10R-lipoxygenase
MLCTGYTISRAILADAIALTRGDRFYTADFTPYNMTAWGFADCQRDPSGFGFGSTLGRLFLRTLPNHFTSNSVYTWFPLMVPAEMNTHLRKLGVLEKYDLARPGVVAPVQVVNDYVEVTQILKNPEFKPTYAGQASQVIRGPG